MKALTCGFVVKVKKVIFLGMGSVEDEFPKKVAKKVMFLTFKHWKYFCLDKADVVSLE